MTPQQNATPSTRPNPAVTRRAAGTSPMVTVVGGGLAGLLAAAHAAAGGARVTLLERGELGGRARTATTDRGFRLNHGPHALYVGAALHRSLERFGIDVAGAPPVLDGAQGLVDGRLGLLPGDARSLLRSDLLPARAKPQLARLLATLPRRNPADHAHQTIDGWLDSEGLRPEVRRLVATIIRLTTYCADHDIASADMAIGQMQLGLGPGVLYLDGGWHQMVDALLMHLEASDVTIRTGTAARSIDGTRVVLADGAVIAADAVIVAGLSPSALSGLVSGAADVVNAAGPPVVAATLDVGVAGEAGLGVILGLDEPVYLSRHDPPAALAPDGHSLFGVMRYLRRDEEHDHRATAAQLESLTRTAGIGRDDIVERRYSHRLVVAQGTPLAERGGLTGRPAVDALGPGGVFLAGDWIGPVGVLADASAASAEAAATAALAHCRTLGARRGADATVA